MCGGADEGNNLTHFLLDVLIEVEPRGPMVVLIVVSVGCDNQHSV